jgi:magnesium-protoporphyrin O-methyltransferase
MFAGKYVARELKKYRRKGASATTQMLIDSLKAEVVEGAALLDIGGGLGAIQHALLDAGASRQGHANNIEFRQGDFVEIAAELEDADVVTLDRVICCYHDMESLVELSARRARRLYGVVYPRVTWWTKIGFRFLNFSLWLSRNPFRVFLHPPARVEELIRAAGFERRFHHETFSWQVCVYRR